jgi:hypothetical protein
LISLCHNIYDHLHPFLRTVHPVSVFLCHHFWHNLSFQFSTAHETPSSRPRMITLKLRFNVDVRPSLYAVPMSNFRRVKCNS